MTEAEAKEIIDRNIAYLDEAFEAGTSYKPNKADWLEGQWSNLRAWRMVKIAAVRLQSPVSKLNW